MKRFLETSSTIDDLKFMLAKLKAKDEVNTFMIIGICFLLVSIIAVGVFVFISKTRGFSSLNCCRDDDDFFYDDADDDFDYDDECACCDTPISARDEDFEK